MGPNSLQARGREHYQAGRVAEAIAALEQARAEFLAQNDAKGAGSAANDLGVAYARAERAADARTTLAEAVMLAQRAGDVVTEAKANGNLAQVLQRSTPDEAGKLYRRAAELFRQAGEKEFEADTWRALSQMELQRGRWMEALASYDRALAAKGGSATLRAFLKIPLKLLGLK